MKLAAIFVKDKQNAGLFRFEASVVSTRKIGKWWQQITISGLLMEEPNMGELFCVMLIKVME